MYETTSTTNTFYSNITSQLRFLSLHHLHKIFPASLLALLLLLLLAYNGFTIFCIQVPFPAKTPPKPTSFSLEYSAADETGKTPKFSSSSVMYAVKEENPVVISKTHLPLRQKSDHLELPWNNPVVIPSTHLPLLQKPDNLEISMNNPVAISKTHLSLLQESDNLELLMNRSSTRTLKRVKKNKSIFKILQYEPKKKRFSSRMKELLSNSSCKVRFFMTWISSLDSFGHREMLTLESLFKSHPSACVIIVSKSMDSRRGIRLLRSFVDKGFHVTAISPDFDYIFKNTYAELWFNKLKKGNVDPGEVSLGQNLSNLLRLALLYKFGGIYIDTDVIVLKSFSNLSNAIGAQTIDLETGKWSRLNNAVMIFDQKHPLLFKFIEEFALTFNGNKWGHNGPYLVSRVVSRVNGRPGFNFTVLPPRAFYPVDWSRIHSFFRAPRDEIHSKWLVRKLKHIRRQSFAVHLWNRQSRKIKVEDGSIISRIMSNSCIFCNSAI